MKKETLSEFDETYELMSDCFDLVRELRLVFLKDRTRKGHLEICKESPKFVVTMKLERKKEK